jgi:hypothetical protein
MAEKLLLHLAFESHLHGIDLPWARAAHRLQPGTSGAAIIQHLARLRERLIAEGHLVPPPTNSRVPLPPDHVRGYIRTENSDDPHESRPVDFSENIDDRTFNVPGVCDVCNGHAAELDHERLDGSEASPLATKTESEHAISPFGTQMQHPAQYAAAAELGPAYQHAPALAGIGDASFGGHYPAALAGIETNSGGYGPHVPYPTLSLGPNLPVDQGFPVNLHPNLGLDLVPSAIDATSISAPGTAAPGIAVAGNNVVGFAAAHVASGFALPPQLATLPGWGDEWEAFKRYRLFTEIYERERAAAYQAPQFAIAAPLAPEATSIVEGAFTLGFDAGGDDNFSVLATNGSPETAESAAHDHLPSVDFSEFVDI